MNKEELRESYGIRKIMCFMCGNKKWESDNKCLMNIDSEARCCSHPDYIEYFG